MEQDQPEGGVMSREIWADVFNHSYGNTYREDIVIRTIKGQIELIADGEVLAALDPFYARRLACNLHAFCDALEGK